MFYTMKMRRIAAGLTAVILAVSVMSMTAFAEIRYYVWGGEGVCWSMDLDNNDENNEDEDPLVSNEFPGYGADGYEKFWVGTLDADEGAATIKIPVEKGAKVQFIAGCWEWYTGVHYTVTIGNQVAEIKWDQDPAFEKNEHSLPTACYEVTDDITELEAEIYYVDWDPSLFHPDHQPAADAKGLYNPYCQGFVHVLTGDDAAMVEAFGFVENGGDKPVESNDFEYSELDDGTLEISRYTGVDAEVVIPSEIDGKKVTSIGRDAFSWCSSLSSITIPDGVTSIDDYAFFGCTSLTSIIIPDSVTSIGCYAFAHTKWLENMQKKDTLVVVNGILIDGTASSGEVSIPESVTSIGIHAFHECLGLTSITIPESVKSIGYSAFKGCTNLSSITIPNSVTSIGDSAFAFCKSLTSLPDGITSIGDYAFESCHGLKNLTIPDGVTSIGKFAFQSCQGLESVIISDSVTSIGFDAFYHCSSLERVTIPESVTSIDIQAFYDCDSLERITIPKSVTEIGYQAFDRGITIYCYSDSYAEEYAIANGYDYELIGDDPEPTVTGSLSLHDKAAGDMSDTVIKAVDADGVSYDITLEPDGSFASDIPAGSYTLTVKKPGYPAKTAEIEIGGEEPLELDLDLYQYGDANNDDSRNMKDFVLFQRHLNSWGVNIDISVLDLNGDGKVNMKDFVLLQRILNGWDVELV